MPEFLELLPPPDALNVLLQSLPVFLQAETIATREALGRVTSSPVAAPHHLPSFIRSTVDGYAVRATDTYGANRFSPVIPVPDRRSAHGWCARFFACSGSVRPDPHWRNAA